MLDVMVADCRNISTVLLIALFREGKDALRL